MNHFILMVLSMGLQFFSTYPMMEEEGGKKIEFEDFEKGLEEIVNFELDDEFKKRLIDTKKEHISIFNTHYSLPINFPESLKDPLVVHFPQIGFQLIKNVADYKDAADIIHHDFYPGKLLTYIMNSAMPRSTNKNFTWYEDYNADADKTVFITRPEVSTDGSYVMFCTVPLKSKNSPLKLYVYDTNNAQFIVGMGTRKQQFMDSSSVKHYAISNQGIVGFLNINNNTCTLFTPATSSLNSLPIPLPLGQLFIHSWNYNFDFNQQGDTIGCFFEYGTKQGPKIETIKTESLSIFTEEGMSEDDDFQEPVPCTRLWLIKKINE